MRKIRIVLWSILGLVTLSYLTNHDYIWGGVRETYFRGWKNSNIDDLEFRDTRTLHASAQPAPWPMDVVTGEALSEEDLAWHQDFKSASMLVMQQDTVLYERYWRGHDLLSLTNSFSACKTVVAMAIGLASDQGLIDLNAPLAQYLPRFEGENGMGLTVQELLQMRSHIPFGESYDSPFGFMAKAYYRSDIRELAQPYRVTDTPGERWKYEGGNTMLLEETLASLGKGSLSEWIERGLWQPMGAEQDAFWGLDAPDEEGGVERCFAQFYATTRDYARFGKLINHSGVWNGDTLISPTFMSQLVTPIADLTEECDATHYGYQIWLGKTSTGDSFSCMEGLRGQMVISVPALDLVVVRTGYDKLKAKRGELPNDIYRCLEMGLRVVEKRG
ncbi:MAG: serine hydrolase [Flavobacteriales bacterium]|nr:serine hydrolase [Flavobacteriales bacterium]